MNDKQNNERREKERRQVEAKKKKLIMRRKNCKKVNQEDLESVLVCVWEKERWIDLLERKMDRFVRKKDG